MTRTEAAAKFAQAYKAYQLSKEIQPSNLEVAVAYATMDMLNTVKTYNDADAVYVILDEASYLEEALRKRAA
jgi:hypothetical protein